MEKIKNKNVNIIAVHHGTFHADDVFAVAILKKVFPNAKIIRTREHALLENADMRVDVGMKYDFSTLDFDHHQFGGAGERHNGIPYSSVGLIWKHFGKGLVKEQIWKYIDEKIIQYIDADDNGLDIYTSKIGIYTIAEVIASFNPRDNESNHEIFNEKFFEAVDFASKLIQNEIDESEFLFDSVKYIMKKIRESKKEGKEYIILEDKLPWRQTVINDSDIKFVLIHNPLEDTWGVCAVPINLDSFVNRKDLPKSWGGLRGEPLQKVTGVSDALFCHTKLFSAFAKSKEGAIKLVEIALRN